MHPHIYLHVKVERKNQMPCRFGEQVIYSALIWGLINFIKEKNVLGSCWMVMTAELDK